ncbi:esterase [Candidatus Pelagibacter bacterium]|nr:esterase [Candidatus Pelagibacter bacterium]
MKKFKLTWRDLSLNDFKVYFFSLFKAFIPKSKIQNLDQLEEFIQTKSAWVSQVTLYSYLKTRMGTRYVLHFDNDEFMKSVNEAKWNIYAVALQDLTLFERLEAKIEKHAGILDDETTNNMPLDIIEKTKKSFEERFQTINWDKYYSNLPFNPSALSLYEWAPIAEELKTLDRKIVLNSVILKWDIIKKEFEDRIQF